MVGKPYPGTRIRGNLAYIVSDVSGLLTAFNGRILSTMNFRTDTLNGFIPSQKRPLNPELAICQTRNWGISPLEIQGMNMV